MGPPASATGTAPGKVTSCLTPRLLLPPPTCGRRLLEGARGGGNWHPAGPETGSHDPPPPPPPPQDVAAAHGQPNGTHVGELETARRKPSTLPDGECPPSPFGTGVYDVPGLFRGGEGGEKTSRCTKSRRPVCAPVPSPSRLEPVTHTHTHVYIHEWPRRGQKPQLYSSVSFSKAQVRSPRPGSGDGCAWAVARGRASPNRRAREDETRRGHGPMRAVRRRRHRTPSKGARAALKRAPVHGLGQGSPYLGRQAASSHTPPSPPPRIRFPHSPSWSAKPCVCFTGP